MSRNRRFCSCSCVNDRLSANTDQCRLLYLVSSTDESTSASLPQFVWSGRHIRSFSSWGFPLVRLLLQAAVSMRLQSFKASFELTCFACESGGARKAALKCELASLVARVSLARTGKDQTLFIGLSCNRRDFSPCTAARFTSTYLPGGVMQNRCDISWVGNLHLENIFGPKGVKKSALAEQYYLSCSYRDIQQKRRT